MSTIKDNKMDAMHSIKNKIDPNTDQSAKFDVFTEEHQIFLAYTKRYLHQQRVHFRFEATFPNLAEPHTVGAFIGMYVSRWAPVQNPSAMDIEQYTWGTELDEFELNPTLNNSPLQVPKKTSTAANLKFRKNAFYMRGRRL